MTYIEQAEAEIRDLRAELAQMAERVRQLEAVLENIRTIIKRHNKE